MHAGRPVHVLVLFRFHYYSRLVCLDYIQVLGDGVKFVFVCICVRAQVLRFLSDTRKIAS